MLAEQLQLESPRISPDGRRIALASTEQRTPDIRVFDIAGGTMSRLTFDGTNRYPSWTPDGKRIAFTTNRAGSQANDLYWTAADGSGEASVLFGGIGNQWEIEFTPDMRQAAVRTVGASGGRDILVLAMDSTRRTRTWLATPFEERAQALSPDGRWLAYVSNESSRDEIYVRAFPEATGRWQVSAAGGQEPRWSPRGNELFYRNDDTLVSVTVSTRPTFSVGARRAVLTEPYIGDPNHAYYDVHPDNQRFIMVKGGLERSSMIVTINFFDELRRRAIVGGESR